MLKVMREEGCEEHGDDNQKAHIHAPQRQCTSPQHSGNLALAQTFLRSMC